MRLRYSHENPFPRILFYPAAIWNGHEMWMPVQEIPCQATAMRRVFSSGDNNS